MVNILKQRDNEKEIFSVQLIPPFPKKNMLIEVTNYCNHQCVFCANSKMKRKRGFIEPEFVYRILEEAHGLGMEEVGFYATGEPLMNPEIFDYIEAAKRIGYQYVYITTNGALLDEEKIKRLILTKLDSIKFSVNAGTRDTYRLMHKRDDFEKVVNNIIQFDLLRKEMNANINLFVSCVVTSINVNEKNDLQQMLKNYVDEIFFSNVGNQGGQMYEENKSLLLDGVDSVQKMCYLPFNAITITHEGYLSACCVDFENNLIIADLNRLSLKEAWESEKFQRLRKMHMEKVYGNTICNNCMKGINENIIAF